MNLSEFIYDYQKKFDVLDSNNTSSSLQLIKSNLERLKQIEKQLAIDTYKLVFIGEPGSGKTTTICNYLNLTKNVKIGERFSGFELFDTASGRTTAFEVHYHRAKQTHFVICPMEISKQKVLIQEYCEYNWRKVFKSDEEENEKNDVVGRDGCSESDRIIRNMLGFTNDTSFQEFVIENYSEDEYGRFLDDMMNRISIEKRTCMMMSYSGEGDVKTWLKRTFNEINFGKRMDTAIPEQVDVYLNPDDLDYVMPDFISEVIDTRGYDGGAREDLREYIYADDTIPVILDKVESLPGERQRKILSEWIDANEYDVINRISLMIKDKDGALSKVNEADDDPEIGEAIKREELSRSISDNKLHYNEDNTLFIDSYEGISLKEEYKIIDNKKKRVGKSITDFDADLRNYDRNRITDHFCKIISKHKKILLEEAYRIEQNTEQLYNVVTTVSEIEELQDKLRDTENRLVAIRDGLNKDVDDYFYDGESPFCDRFKRNVHWASARKTASRAWHGTWHKANIYAEYMDFCEIVVKQYSSSKKEQIIGYIEELKEHGENSVEINSFVDSCITRIDLEYRQLIDKIRTGSRNCAESQLDSFFWEETENVSGGQGYYKRLMETICRKMRRSRLLLNTSDDIQDAIKQFFEDIIIALKNKSNTL